MFTYVTRSTKTTTTFAWQGLSTHSSTSVGAIKGPAEPKLQRKFLFLFWNFRNQKNAATPTSKASSSPNTIEAVRFTQGTQDFSFILARFAVNRAESLARDTIFGKTWQDISGVALHENSCKKKSYENWTAPFPPASTGFPLLRCLRGIPFSQKIQRSK